MVIGLFDTDSMEDTRYQNLESLGTWDQGTPEPQDLAYLFQDASVTPEQHNGLESINLSYQYLTDPRK